MPTESNDGDIKLKASIDIQLTKVRQAFDKVFSAWRKTGRDLQQSASETYQSMAKESRDATNDVLKDFTASKKSAAELNSAISDVSKTIRELADIREQLLNTEELLELEDSFGNAYNNTDEGIQALEKTIGDLGKVLDQLGTEWDKAFVSELSNVPINKRKELLQQLISYYNELIQVQADLQRHPLASIEDSTGKMWEGAGAADELKQELNQLKFQIDEVNKSFGSQSNVRRVEEVYSRLAIRFRALVTLFGELKNAAVSTFNVLRKFPRHIFNIAAALKTPQTFLAKILPRVPGLLRNISKQNNSTGLSLKKLIGSLIAAGLGIKSIGALWNKVRSMTVDGIKSLVLVDEETNQSISNLITALNTLKGTFASAFAPILNTVAPILTTFINLLATAINYVGMFIAAISGRKTYYKAIGVQQDYAESLRDTAGAAGDASAAMKDYLSGIDEIRKFDSGKDSGSGGGGGAGVKDLTGGIDWEESPILENIQNMADKIKEYIKAQDWEGLGEYMAKGVNTGLQKLYSALDWKKIGPKVIPVVDAITGTFNSLVDNINWDLMGKTVGRGVNTLVNTANRFLTGVNWNNLGQKFATGINGFVTEVDWANVGQLLGNKVMALWNTFNGFVNKLDWNLIGNAIGDAINGFFDRYNLSTITGSIATFLNGLFTTLLTATRRIHWQDIVKNITDGINTFIRDFKWAENGEALEEFLDNLLGALVDTVDGVNWEELGEGIGEFLSKINWTKHLRQVAHIFWTALRGLISGLWETTEGKVLVLTIAGWFTAAKIMPIANAIATAFTTKSVTQLIGGAVAKAIAGGAAGTAGAAAGAGAEAAGAAGAAGAGAAGGGLSGLLGAVAPFAAAGGILTAFFAGGTIASNKFSKEIIDNRKNVEKAADSYDELSKDINAEVTAMEMSGKKTKNNTKLVDYRTQAVEAQSEAEKQSKEAKAELAEIEEQLATKFNTSTSALNVDVEAMEAGALGTGDVSEATERLTRRKKELTKIIEAADGQYKKATDDIKKLDSAMGGVNATTKTAATDISKSADSIKTSFKNSFDIDVTGKMKKMVTDAVDTTKAQTQTQMNSKTTKASISKSIIDPFAAVDLNTPMGKKGKAGVNAMVTDAKTQASNKATATQKVGKTFASNVGTGIQDGSSGIGTKISSAMNTVVSTLAGYSQSFKNTGASLASDLTSSLDSGIKAVKMPALDYKVEKRLDPANNINKLVATPYWYASGGLFSKANIIGVGEAGREAVLPLENKRTMGIIANAIINGLGNKLSGFTIPKLAKGAVIPANKEFLATLGDQRNGNNLELPENLLRQIVREETAGGNSQYQFTAQINRRTLFDEFIKEAKLRQMQTGRNPLEFA